jgi:hypothetical protein
VVFLISVPSVIAGSIPRTKNITCASGSANWLIAFGCIGVGETVILITFVSNLDKVYILNFFLGTFKNNMFSTKDRAAPRRVLKIGISILIVGSSI